VTVYVFIASKSTEPFIVPFSSVTERHRQWVKQSHQNYRTMQTSLGAKEKWPAYEFYLDKQESLSMMHVFYLPKYVELTYECKKWLKQATEDQLTACYIALAGYFEFVDSLHRPIERSGLTKVFGETSNFLDLQIEIETVHTLWNYLRTRQYVEPEYICSDLIIGEVDVELNLYHTELHTRIQLVEVNHEQIYEIVNSYIYHRYAGSILEHCEGGTTVIPPKIEQLIFQLRKLKTKTKYAEQRKFLTEKELLVKRKVVLKRDKRLYKLLEQLRQYHAWDTSNLLVQQVLNMPHIWEQYLYKYTFGEPSDFQKPSTVFLEENDTKSKKNAEPEYVDENAVYDAKYKRLEKFSIMKVSDSDINKLLRDMLVYNRKHGVLVYPSPMRFLEFLHIHGVDTTVDWFQSEVSKVSTVTKQVAGLHTVRMSYVPFVVCKDSTSKMLDSQLNPFTNIKWDVV